MKRGQPLKRKTPLRSASPLKARTPMKRTAMRRAPPKRIGSPTDDPAYLAQVRTLPCAALYLSDDNECRGRIEAHHQTHDRGMGTKAPDKDTLPLCLVHHHDFHAATGAFKGWSREERREWQTQAVIRTRGMLHEFNPTQNPTHERTPTP